MVERMYVPIVTRRGIRVGLAIDPITVPSSRLALLDYASSGDGSVVAASLNDR
jgi:hypothetical protein